MDNLISFDIIPTLAEYYVIENLQINYCLLGFRGETKLNEIKYELDIYKKSVEIYANKDGGATFKLLCSIKQGEVFYEVAVEEVQNVFKLFKSEMQEYVERKKKWQQKKKINISV